jgi:hypothetical protein
MARVVHCMSGMNATNETLVKLMELREEGERLAVSYARAESLSVKSAKVIELMGLVSCRLMQNAREYKTLRATLPIQ